MEKLDFTTDSDVAENYWNTLNNTLKNGPTNSFSLKLIYWLDTLSLRKKLSEALKIIKRLKH